jgi:hypothetical protein
MFYQPIILHSCMDSKKLRKRYMQIMPHLNKALQHVNDQLSDLPPSEFILETNLKPYSSVKRKMLSDHENDPVALSDLVRGRLFFSEQFNFEDVEDILHKLFGDKIKKVDDKSKRKEEFGLEYHGIRHIDMNINGVNFELQIMPIEFKPYKEFLHQIYDKFRDPKTREKLTDKQKEILRKVNNKLYKTLDQQSKINREQSED